MMWVMGCGHQHLQTATGFHPRHEVCQGLKHCKHIVMTGFYNCQTTAELQKVRGGGVFPDWLLRKCGSEISTGFFPCGNL